MSALGADTRPTRAERLARVVLSRACEPGDLITAALVSQVGPEAAVQAQLAPRVNSGLHQRLVAVEPERELDLAARLGIRFVIPGDPEWPDGLADLEHAELQGMGGIPVGLWVRGPLDLRRLDLSVAVVGSRASTVYGTQIAGEIAAEIARAGMPVVSGAAFGIDVAAHRGALGARGVTVAVLACGADRSYPASHHGLLSDLVADHAVVSEVPPNSSPTRQRFLARNRLIAALTRGTVVVEAALRSGALNTAHWADQLSRHVMGVPGPVTSAASQGVHQRVRSGGAVLVTHGSEVLELVGAAGDHLFTMQRGPERPRDALSPIEQSVLEAVPLVAVADADSIARVAARHVRDVVGALRRLEEKGFVELRHGGWRQGDAARS